MKLVILLMQFSLKKMCLNNATSDMQIFFALRLLKQTGTILVGQARCPVHAASTGKVLSSAREMPLIYEKCQIE